MPPSTSGWTGPHGRVILVMPYQAILRELERKADLDPLDYIAFAPEDSRSQFSYGSEHVSHGAASWTRTIAGSFSLAIPTSSRRSARAVLSLS